ncbi:MAG: aminotransferase class I/II-fold pyridoxal phosphate-dependent enzyme [Alistipes sp.]|nr:aminotransferase class I/II-fold pyridoxal phosphate-dependent enzyme [Alistipes sp.]MBQ9961878.1 aminotransferase class I/II-fold pyridoxal phosphate-dependent enzyme [Alistipes sp.]
MIKSFQPTLSQRLDGVGEYYFSKKLREIDNMRKEGKTIISLGIGSPDMPPHPSVMARLAEESSKPNTHGYQSYKGAEQLRVAFAEWYGRMFGVELNADSEIMPLIGSKEGIMHIAMTYLNAGDRVLVPNPGYPTYTSAVTLAGGVATPYNLTAESGWLPDFENIDTQGVKLMIINYPHMPTGAVATLEDLAKIVAFCREHSILLLNDNPYGFIRNSHPVSLLQVEGAKDIAMELNSLSKSHNMAGWRVGMLAASEQRITEVLRFKSNMDSGMFLPLQLAAATALGLGQQWYDSQNEEYYRREELGKAIFDVLGLEYADNQAGLFLWGRLPKGQNCYDFCDHLLYEKGIFLTPGGIFGSEGESYMRLSLCAPQQVLENVLEILR